MALFSLLSLSAKPLQTEWEKERENMQVGCPIEKGKPLLKYQIKNHPKL
jgi:hypothetical protein